MCAANAGEAWVRWDPKRKRSGVLFENILNKFHKDDIYKIYFFYKIFLHINIMDCVKCLNIFLNNY